MYEVGQRKWGSCVTKTGSDRRRWDLNFGPKVQQTPVSRCVTFICATEYMDLFSFVEYSVTATEIAAIIAVQTSRNKRLRMPTRKF